MNQGDTTKRVISKRLSASAVVIVISLVLFGCGIKKNYQKTPLFRIVSTTVSKNIYVTNDEGIPKDVTDIFSSDDTEIVSHIRYANLSGTHHLRWEWYAPDGSLYHATKKVPVQTSTNTYVKQGTSWHKIPITKEMTTKSLGRWAVKIYVDNDLVASDFFRIKPPDGESGFGNYHALLIGNNQYQFFRKLNTAENDARDVASVLKNFYGFKVNLLINATRSDIMLALNKLRSNLTEADNLVIFYAGHGYLDAEGDEGYWLPIDAKKDNEINWVSNSYIATVLKAITARHVLIVSDSCYSGKLTRETGVAQVRLKDLNYYKNISRKKSRCVLSSGGIEPVIDGGGKDGHSVFTSAFIDTLTDNKGIMDSNLLFNQVRHMVILNSSQTPEYSDLRNAGHEGGDLLFIRK